MIAQRLESIPGLLGRFQWISPEEVQHRMAGLRPILGESIPREYAEVREFDGRDTGVSAIADWLHAQINVDEQVRTIWLADRAGILISLSDFLQFFDQLWYPSSDDMIVESNSNIFVIVIDHEEQVRLFLRTRR